MVTSTVVLVLGLSTIVNFACTTSKAPTSQDTFPYNMSQYKAFVGQDGKYGCKDPSGRVVLPAISDTEYQCAMLWRHDHPAEGDEVGRDWSPILVTREWGVATSRRQRRRASVAPCFRLIPNGIAWTILKTRPI